MASFSNREIGLMVGLGVFALMTIILAIMLYIYRDGIGLNCTEASGPSGYICYRKKKPSSVS